MAVESNSVNSFKSEKDCRGILTSLYNNAHDTLGLGLEVEPFITSVIAMAATWQQYEALPVTPQPITVETVTGGRLQGETNARHFSVPAEEAREVMSHFQNVFAGSEALHKVISLGHEGRTYTYDVLLVPLGETNQGVWIGDIFVRLRGDSHSEAWFCLSSEGSEVYTLEVNQNLAEEVISFQDMILPFYSGLCSNSVLTALTDLALTDSLTRETVATVLDSVIGEELAPLQNGLNDLINLIPIEKPSLTESLSVVSAWLAGWDPSNVASESGSHYEFNEPPVCTTSILVAGEALGSVISFICQAALSLISPVLGIIAGGAMQLANELISSAKENSRTEPIDGAKERAFRMVDTPFLQVVYPRSVFTSNAPSIVNRLDQASTGAVIFYNECLTGVAFNAGPGTIGLEVFPGDCSNISEEYLNNGNLSRYNPDTGVATFSLLQRRIFADIPQHYDTTGTWPTIKFLSGDVWSTNSCLRMNAMRRCAMAISKVILTAIASKLGRTTLPVPVPKKEGDDILAWYNGTAQPNYNFDRCVQIIATDLANLCNQTADGHPVDLRPFLYPKFPNDGPGGVHPLIIGNWGGDYKDMWVGWTNVLSRAYRTLFSLDAEGFTYLDVDFGKYTIVSTLLQEIDATITDDNIGPWSENLYGPSTLVPLSRFSWQAKLAVTGAIAIGAVAASIVIKTKTKKAIRKFKAKKEAEYWNAMNKFNSDPTDDNFNAYWKASKKNTLADNLMRMMSGSSTPAQSSVLSNTTAIYKAITGKNP